MLRCPDLQELPPPPAGKTGWPWTEASPRLADAMPDGAPWPGITIVTPSYNQAGFIEETIRSVLLQGYPNLEYQIIDGGSTDGSAEIIRKYESWLAYWVTEPDGGQADALAKGFSRASGTLLGWLNSDDTYLPGAISAIATLHAATPLALVAGSVINTRGPADAGRLVPQRNLSLRAFVRLWDRTLSWHQPGIFFPRAAYELAGGIDASLRYCMDLDLMCRLMGLSLPVVHIEQPLARFRVHPASKTSAENTRMALEAYSTTMRYWHLLGESRTCYALRMLLHLSLRSLKWLLLGAPRDARDSLVGGLRLFAAAMERQ